MLGRFRTSIGALGSACLALLAGPAQASLDTVNPVPGPTVTGSIPPLPVAPGTTPGGFLFQPPLIATGQLAVHEGSYSWAPNLAGGPAQGPSCPSQLPANLTSVAPPAVSVRLTEATSASSTTLAKLDSAALGDALDALETFSELLALLPNSQGGVTVPTSSSNSCRSYRPVYGRWLAGQWAKPTGTGFDLFFGYHPSPRPFRELRERGARLYCAARAAQFAQGSSNSSMGAQAGFTVNIAGSEVDFLVSEGGLVLDGPKKFVGTTNDGAQAFEVPLLLRTRFQPIDFLPGLGTVSVPVSLVAADAEIQTPANLRFIVKPGQAVVRDYAKTYQTVTHVDRILSATRIAKLDGPKTEILRVGPVAIAYDFNLTYAVGVDGPNPGRVIRFPGFPTSRGGRLWQQPGTNRRTHDGAWTLLLPFFGIFPGSAVSVPTYAVWQEGIQDPFWREPANLLTPPALDIRLLQNDDHAIDSRNSLTLDGSLIGILGGSFGPLEVALEVLGTLTANVTQSFPLRDALLAQDQGAIRMTPITGLGVRTRREASATATASAVLHFSLDLFLDEIDWDETLFKVDPPVTLAAYNSDGALPPTGTAANDGASFRLGTGSSAGDVMKKPKSWSHLPSPSGGAEFESFAVDVDACLADPTPNPDTPPECDPIEAEGGPPQKQLCVYGPTTDLEVFLDAGIPPNVCADLPGYLAQLPGEVVECAGSLFSFLCSGKSWQQSFDSFTEVVAHVLELGTPEDPNEDELGAFKAVFETCAAGLGGAQAAAPKLFDYAICDGEAEALIPGDEVLAAVSPTQVPPVKAALACH
jgi:hypothetical protein